jgi:hypothetical protein
MSTNYSSDGPVQPLINIKNEKEKKMYDSRTFEIPGDGRHTLTSQVYLCLSYVSRNRSSYMKRTYYTDPNDSTSLQYTKNMDSDE